MPYDRVPSNVANPDLFFADPDQYIRYWLLVPVYLTYADLDIMFLLLQ